MKLILPPDANQMQLFDDNGNNITHLFKIASITIQPINAQQTRTIVTMALTNVDVELELLKEHAVVYDADAYKAHEERAAMDQKANWFAASNGKLM
jgi:hypothetical protein